MEINRKKNNNEQEQYTFNNVCLFPYSKMANKSNETSANFVETTIFWSYFFFRLFISVRSAWISSYQMQSLATHVPHKFDDVFFCCSIWLPQSVRQWIIYWEMCKSYLLTAPKQWKKQYGNTDHRYIICIMKLIIIDIRSFRIESEKYAY